MADKTQQVKNLTKELNDFAIEFWRHNSFENCVIEIVNRKIKHIKQKK